MSTAGNTKVVTEPVRLSYVNVFEPTAGPNGGKPRYSTTILIPKSDTATLSKIKAALKTAIEQGRSNGKLKGVPNDSLILPVKDGDTDKAAFTYDDDGEKDAPKEGYPGHKFIRLNSYNPPGVVNRQAAKIMDSSEVYSGCFARVSMNAFAYNTAGNAGITFGLNNVMKWADGDALGGRARAEDDFAAFVNEEEDESALSDDDSIDILA